MGVTTDSNRTSWDEQRRHSARQTAADTEAESVESALELARQLADRLARVRVSDRHTDALRLARAMALNVVDILEGSHR
ncbi:MAG: hypothetical protein QM820_02615 [Minicystis sp.]